MGEVNGVAAVAVLAVALLTNTTVAIFLRERKLFGEANGGIDVALKKKRKDGKKGERTLQGDKGEDEGMQLEIRVFFFSLFFLII